MAFVFRSKRDIKLTSNEESNIYSGEYHQEPQLIKNIDKQSPEFQSKSPRNLIKTKFNTPGPGSYEKNNFDQDIFEKFTKIKRPKNIIETIKLSVIPTEIQEYIEKYKSIGFNSRAQRFNYKNEELEKNKPGPGAYEPDINNKNNISSKKSDKINNINKQNINNTNNNNNNQDLIKSKTKSNISLDLNLISNSNNNNKSNNHNNISNNNSSILSNSNINNNKSTDSTSANSNINKLVKMTKSFNSKYRIETIPSKHNLGYDIDKNGDKKMITYNKDKFQMDGTIKDSAGPGQYDIPISWEKNVLYWDKMKDEKDEKYNIIKSRKNISPLTQLEQDYLINTKKEYNNLKNEDGNYTNNIKMKTKTEINYSPNNNPRTRIFNYLMNLRYDKMKSMAEKKDNFDDLIFDGTPGPGYYSPPLDTLSPRFSTKNVTSNIPRFKNFVKENNNLGPGFYYNKSKPKKIEKPKIILGITPNKEENNLCALKISLTKENYKVPGPGSYEIEKNFIKEDITGNQNFGSNDIRFKKNFKIVENIPGPGSYNIKSIFQNDKKKENNKNLKWNNVYKNYKSDLELIKELDKIPKEEYNYPPVGFYNPNIVSSMEYEIKSKINPYLDEKNVGFGTQEKKGMSLINGENNINIGPGKYYKNKKPDKKQNSVAFNQSNKRFNYDKESNKYIPGPGAYDINSFENWNKKSHNILFV